MKKVRVIMLSALMMLLLCSLVSQAQQRVALATNEIVPPLVSFSGAVTDVNGKPLAGTVGVTFSLYKDEQRGAPLWLETQNVQSDKTGHYSVMLGSASSQGIPNNLFVSGEAHWLGIRVQGQDEQPRVLLLSVPYALKAADAETVGGLPPSAFVLAALPSPGSSTDTSSGSSSNSNSNPPALGGSGKKNFLPIWTNSTTLGSSVLFQSGTGAKAKVGIGTITPASTLDVKGGGTIRGLFSLPPTGTATANMGFNSQPMNLAASAFNSITSTAVNQTFQWQTEPASNDTSTPSGTLNLLFGEGATPPSETGLNIASNGQITFATGQTFPGTGPGTVTSVGSGLGLTGGPITTSGTLAIDTTVVPQLGTANTFTGNQTVNGNVIATNVTAANVTATATVSGGVVNAGTSFDLGGTPFGYGSVSNANAFLGFAGNSTMTGGGNTASGSGALVANTTGTQNTAVGQAALAANTSGVNNIAIGPAALGANTSSSDSVAIGIYALLNNNGGNNTAIGTNALRSNTTGFENTSVGQNALFQNTGGSLNTALGYNAEVASGNLTNATAIGANAIVSQSNALVLGGPSVNVGIGTAAPANVFTIAQGAGKAISDGWTVYSSRRWKTNIQTLHGALRKVEQLRGVSYDLKANGQHEVGVIAEEVGAVVPELVTYEENGKDARGVDYSRLTALLIEATKEQQALIRYQQKLIRAQQTQLRSQQTQIRAAQAQSTAQQTQISQLVSQVQTIQVSLSSGRPAGFEVRTASVRTTSR